MAASHIETPRSRRDFLLRAGAGFGSLALTDLLQSQNTAQAAAATSPLAPKPGHHRARAKSVIFLFMEGGPSHLDLFDPKPELRRLAGQKLPKSFGEVITAMGEYNSPLLADQRQWKQHGESGLWVSDWLPHTAKVIDNIAVLRSCWANGLNHVGSVCQMNTGQVLSGRPSLGAWASYGLGSENQNLPSFVVLRDRKDMVVGGPRNWGTGFMPSTYQGTDLQFGDEPIPNLSTPSGLSEQRQQAKLAFLNSLNRRHLSRQSQTDELDARIHSYELAFRMQAEAPEAVDLAAEPASIRSLYGLDREPTESMARCCILARRMVERGVRFVQIYSGSGSKWDAHSGIEKNHGGLCAASDQPVAALITDLKQRGLLEDTLVVWGGEFGRTPMSEKGDGRDHNPYGFTMWFAGGGIKGGQTVGTTDDLGLHAVEDRAHVHDIHATILHQLGLNHMKLDYMDNGRLQRPTINEGEPVHKLLA